VTGQIGCGKTTLSRKICACLGLTHLHLDDYYGAEDQHKAAEDAARAVDGGWVAEACVWQIPQEIWESSDLAVFLDYPNRVCYFRIVRRCIGKCLRRPTWGNVRDTVRREWHHLQIMYRYANENRAGWERAGGITSASVPVVRCAAPPQARKLLQRIRSQATGSGCGTTLPQCSA
jgi:adenylate kinase family enzyme